MALPAPEIPTAQFRPPFAPVDLLLQLRESIFGGAFASHVFAWAQLISFIISGLFMWGIVYVYFKNAKLEKRPATPKRGPSEKFKSKDVAKDLWFGILQRVQKDTPQDLAFAIIEADKLIDAILKSNGFSGETMAERMKRINPQQLTSIEHLWEAHKIRNDIVHTPGYVVTHELAKKVLRDYEKVLKELEAI